MTGTFFGAAMLAVASRTFVRTYYLRKVSLDDYPFYIAVASLIASLSLILVFANSQYLFSRVAAGVTPPSRLAQGAGANIVFYAIIGEMLCWLTIFAVKFSFLLYFRALIRRLPRVELWWWITLAILVPVAATATFGVFIVCAPERSSLPGSHVASYGTGRALSLTATMVKCTPSSNLVQQLNQFLCYIVVADIVTDAMRKSSFWPSCALPADL